MKASQIEKWVLDIIDRVVEGKPHEDSRVELKAEWIDPIKAARRLAGHANAARGDPILWIIGVDEVRGVIGAKHEELSAWFEVVNSQFDGIPLSPVDLVIPHELGTVVALYFETDRAPYVVNNPLFGKTKKLAASHEVPWREGSKVRTARRSDLLRILVPKLSLPELEVLSAELNLSESSGNYLWYLTIAMYVIPSLGESIAFPYHRCNVKLSVPPQFEFVQMSSIRIVPPYQPVPGGRGFQQEPASQTIAHTEYSAIVYGPGWIKLSASYLTQPPLESLEGLNAYLQVTIRPTYVDVPITFELELNWETPKRNEFGLWKLRGG